MAHTELMWTDFNEAAVESTKAHYAIVHDSIRIRILDSLRAIESTQCAIMDAERVQVVVDHQEHKVEEPQPESRRERKSRDKRVRELWHRICRMCHPDKCGKHDKNLIEFMNIAQGYYQSNSLDELKEIYDQVLMYLNNAELFLKCKEKVVTTIRMEEDPWYAVHASHTKGDVGTAFKLSFKILTEILASNNAHLNHLQGILNGILKTNSRPS